MVMNRTAEKTLNAASLRKLWILSIAFIIFISKPAVAGGRCDFILAGDFNNDCVVNFIDVTVLANNWLILCEANSPHPACVPIDGGGLCESCTDHNDCLGQGSRCILLDDGQYCATACDSPIDCPLGYSCVNVDGFTVCVPDTFACTCQADNIGQERGCSHTIPGQEYSYTCHGTQICTVTGWSQCVLPEEMCDYLDNDCDGVVDSGFVDETGRYVTDEHCGSCGNDCTLLDFGGQPGVCNNYVNPPRCSVQCPPNCFDCDGDPDNGCEVCDPPPGCENPCDCPS